MTSVSWIPSENIPGLMKLPFQFGPGHFDDPPADILSDLPALAASSRIRFANELRAYIDVEDGKITGYGHLGRGWMGITRLNLGQRAMSFPGVPLEDLRPEPEQTGDGVRFTQTTGGHVAFPFPRRVSRPPFVQLQAPLVWTTLALNIRRDGSSSYEVAGASPFPRHWIYDNSRRLAAKSGTADFMTWSREIFGEHTPWGAQDSPALIAEVESALERELSLRIMRGGSKPRLGSLEPGQDLVKQGEPGQELFLLLDGLLAVQVDGKEIATVGPGAILGERAAIEGGVRTATLRAVTRCKVAVASADQISPEALAEVAKSHRREEG